jgi:hypothetical protein
MEDDGGNFPCSPFSVYIYTLEALAMAMDGVFKLELELESKLKLKLGWSLKLEWLDCGSLGERNEAESWKRSMEMKDER